MAFVGHEPVEAYSRSVAAFMKFDQHSGPSCSKRR